MGATVTSVERSGIRTYSSNHADLAYVLHPTLPRYHRTDQLGSVESPNFARKGKVSKVENIKEKPRKQIVFTPATTRVDDLGPILSRRLFSLFFRQDSFHS